MRRAALWAGALTLIALILVSSLSTTKRPVPDVRRMTIEDARAALSSAGFSADVGDGSCDAFARGYTVVEVIVAEQRPAPGTLFRVDRSVQIRSGIRIGGRPSEHECGTWPDTEQDAARLARTLALGVPPLFLAAYAAADMRRRGERAYLWACFMFFLFPIALPVWLVVRARTPVVLSGAPPDYSAWGNDGDSLRRP